MPVMQIGVMGMPVRDRRMDVLVCMWLVPVPLEVMLVPVVFVVDMPVGVTDRLLGVLVPMAFGEMKPDPGSHQSRRRPEPRSGAFPEEEHGDQRAGERRDGKIGAGPRRAQIAQRQHEEHQTDTIADEPDRGRPAAWSGEGSVPP